MSTTDFFSSRKVKFLKEQDISTSGYKIRKVLIFPKLKRAVSLSENKYVDVYTLERTKYTYQKIITTFKGIENIIKWNNESFLTLYFSELFLYSLSDDLKKPPRKVYEKSGDCVFENLMKISDEIIVLRKNWSSLLLIHVPAGKLIKVLSCSPPNMGIINCRNLFQKSHDRSKSHFYYCSNNPHVVNWINFEEDRIDDRFGDKEEGFTSSISCYSSFLKNSKEFLVMGVNRVNNPENVWKSSDSIILVFNTSSTCDQPIKSISGVEYMNTFSVCKHRYLFISTYSKGIVHLMDLRLLLSVLDDKGQQPSYILSKKQCTKLDYNSSIHSLVPFVERKQMKFIFGSFGGEVIVMCVNGVEIEDEDEDEKKLDLLERSQFLKKNYMNPDDGDNNNNDTSNFVIILQKNRISMSICKIFLIL